MFYNDSEKLESIRKNEIPMPHNQGVAGSCPEGTTKEADPKGQLLFFLGGEEKFRRITTEN